MSIYDFKRREGCYVSVVFYEDLFENSMWSGFEERKIIVRRIG